jgi:hypothetical protein
MIENNLFVTVDKIIKIVEDMYPKIKDYPIQLCWDNEIHLQNYAGLCSYCYKEKSFTIKLDCEKSKVSTQLISTLIHEFSHVVTQVYYGNMVHSRTFNKVNSLIYAKVIGGKSEIRRLKKLGYK